MAKTAVVTARVEPEIKERAEKVFRALGISASEAINLFYNQVRLRQGLPFDVRLPNEETQRAIEEARDGRDLRSYDSLDSMWRDLDAAD